MFRVSFKNHMELSGIADNKANIMLSINAIIISVSLSTLIPNFSKSQVLIKFHQIARSFNLKQIGTQIQLINRITINRIKIKF